MYPLHFDQTICRLLYLGLSIILRQRNYRASLVGPRLLHLRFFARRHTLDKIYVYLYAQTAVSYITIQWNVSRSND